MLHRQRIPNRDDLFSNWWMTSAPQIALFLKFLDQNKCAVVLDGQNWIIETKYVRHNTMENSYVG
jgi:hypothetical protein